MTAIQVEAGRGWGWIVEGWRLFAQAPGVWIVLLLIYLAVSVAISLIPVVGLLAHALLNPVLIGGLFYGAAVQARGEPLEVAHLFRGFQDQERMGPLIVLGAISVAGYLLIGLLIVVLIGGGLAAWFVLDSSGMDASSQTLEILLIGAALLAGLIVLTIGALIAMALFYGVPLVMLAGQNAWPAAQDSIAACWINMLPLLVFGLVYLGLIMVAAIPLGFGFLILFPVTVCAAYASYQEVFAEVRSTVRLRK
ncbi:MAG: hypothetical protein HC889_01860 [Synechococcaceae cyanobacterium SM1_2_3]|nr:hypothetical protein [Synechococcaceae cyanobacterium SM1_2_3]